MAYSYSQPFPAARFIFWPLSPTVTLELYIACSLGISIYLTKVFGNRGVGSLYFPLVFLSKSQHKIYQITLLSSGKIQESTYAAFCAWTSAMLIRQTFYTFRQTEAVVILQNSIFRAEMNSEQN